MVLSDLNRAFWHDVLMRQGDREVRLRRQYLANLVLPTGRIVACDPCVYPETSAFSQTVAPGTYPVSVTLRTSSVATDVAYALIQFLPHQPIRWEEARWPLPEGEDIPPDGSFAYIVDAGVGCFMDAEIAQCIIEQDKATHGATGYRLGAELTAAWKEGWGWIDFTFPETTANVIVFSSGYGDGIYSSYFGYDAHDTLVCLVTDFEIMGGHFQTENAPCVI